MEFSPDSSQPSAEVTFYFGSHEKAGDAIKFQSLLEEADIYIPEIRGWTDNASDRWANIASGDETPEQANLICIKNREGKRSAFTLQV